MRIAVLGAGAFGTALAVALAQEGRDVVLWGRSVGAMAETRENRSRLPGVRLPAALEVSADLAVARGADCVLLAVPAQQIGDFLQENSAFWGTAPMVACAKGIDVARGVGPVGLIQAALPGVAAAVLTGPSFAADIARGLPTALTLACADLGVGRALQHGLATANLRLYLTADTAGAQLGGALKNVIAIACGAAMGAGLGDSARAALMTRGFAEMQRLAPHFGARPETLNGLSGLGDLALTCTSDLSRNYRFGHALGAGQAPDAAMTVEGAATAEAVATIAVARGIDLPVCQAVADLAAGRIGPEGALRRLLARPLREE